MLQPRLTKLAIAAEATLFPSKKKNDKNNKKRIFVSKKIRTQNLQSIAILH